MSLTADGSGCSGYSWMLLEWRKSGGSRNRNATAAGGIRTRTWLLIADLLQYAEHGGRIRRSYNDRIDGRLNPEGLLLCGRDTSGSEGGRYHVIQREAVGCWRVWRPCWPVRSPWARIERRANPPAKAVPTSSTRSRAAWLSSPAGPMDHVSPKGIASASRSDRTEGSSGHSGDRCSRSGGRCPRRQDRP